jgi:hypothetical protein
MWLVPLIRRRSPICCHPSGCNAARVSWSMGQRRGND